MLAFYDDFGRGMDGMQLPWVAECFRAVVGIQPKTIRQDSGTPTATADSAPETGDTAEDIGEDTGEDTVPVALAPAAEPPADDDTGMLLIDFR